MADVPGKQSYGLWTKQLQRQAGEPAAGNPQAALASGAFEDWGVLVQSIQIGELSSRSMEGYDALLLSTFLLGLTPVAAFPALMTCGPGKK